MKKIVRWSDSDLCTNIFHQEIPHGTFNVVLPNQQIGHARFTWKFYYYNLQNKLIHLRDFAEHHRHVTERHKQTRE